MANIYKVFALIVGSLFLLLAPLATADEIDPELGDLHTPPSYIEERDLPPPTNYQAAPYTPPQSPVPLPLEGSGSELFARGQYKEAYAALWPYVQQGDPEATFYALIIRRNGLDGQAPAKAQELNTLWAILMDNRYIMGQQVKDVQVPSAKKQVFNTILAQLQFFGATHPGHWPPPFTTTGHENAKEALKLLRDDTTRNFTPAMNFAAFLNLTEQIDSPNQAFRNTLRASEKGDYLAMSNLSWLYRDGVGTDKNNMRAAHWARQGCNSAPPVARSANELGYLYESGRGVTQDLAEARLWYGKSAAGHDAAGRTNQNRAGKSSPPPSLGNYILF